MLTIKTFPDKIHERSKIMNFIILSVTFPSFVISWFLMTRLFYILTTSKHEKKFNNIVRDLDEFMPEEDEEESINVALLEDKVYWVHNNTFYVAEFVNGEVDETSSRPIDAFEMSNSDIRKMLFILDNLVEG